MTVRVQARIFNFMSDAPKPLRRNHQNEGLKLQTKSYTRKSQYKLANIYLFIHLLRGLLFLWSMYRLKSDMHV